MDYSVLGKIKIVHGNDIFREAVFYGVENRKLASYGFFAVLSVIVAKIKIFLYFSSYSRQK